jgi:hypothetical protein
MRIKALECLRAGELPDNVANRDLIIRIAKGWLATASAIESRAAKKERRSRAKLRPAPDVTLNI